MTETEEKIERLQAQLDRLVKTQVDFQREVSQIRHEIGVLLRGVQQKRVLPADKTPMNTQVDAIDNDGAPPESAAIIAGRQTNQQTNQDAHRRASEPEFEFSTESKSSTRYETQPVSRSEKSDLEKFIGENLISKSASSS